MKQSRLDSGINVELQIEVTYQIDIPTKNVLLFFIEKKNRKDQMKEVESK